MLAVNLQFTSFQPLTHTYTHVNIKPLHAIYTFFRRTFFFDKHIFVYAAHTNDFILKWEMCARLNTSFDHSIFFGVVVSFSLSLRFIFYCFARGDTHGFTDSFHLATCVYVFLSIFILFWLAVFQSALTFAQVRTCWFLYLYLVFCMCIVNFPLSSSNVLCLTLI